MRTHSSSSDNVIDRELREYVEGSPEAFVGFDRAGHIAFVNRRAEALLGYDRSELLGHPIGLLLPALALAQPSAAAGAPPFEVPTSGFPLKLEARRCDGRTFPAELTLTPIESVHGLLIVGRIEDRTERVEVERERTELIELERATRAELEAAYRSRDAFLAALSHELRTPLNSMLGWAQILRSGPRDEETTARGLETIERNVRAQVRLIDDLLDVASVLAGNLRLELRPLQVGPVIEAAIALKARDAERGGLRLTRQLDPAAGDILGDPDRLCQVVVHLLSNAIKFTPSGGEVSVGLRRAGSSIEIVVRDTGEGIAPRLLPHVFDRFHQGDSTTTRAHGGLGVGLFLVKTLVESHGGSASAESPGVNQGATFTVWLPVAREIAETRPSETGEQTGGSASDWGAESRALAGLRVLVVEDEEDTREFMLRVLEDSGAEVITAASAADALRAIEAARPAVMVCDIGMPGEDGRQLIRKLRDLGHEHGGDLPAAALSAYASAEDRRASLEAGFQLHLTKPIEPTVIVRRLAELAKRRRTG